MKGKERGLQKRILNINPRALFVPCNAHSLNLVVNDAVKSCVSVVTFFDLIQHVFVFFSSSMKRWDVMKKTCQCFEFKTIEEYKMGKSH